MKWGGESLSIAMPCGPARKSEEFKFKIYLLQLWFYQAYSLRTGKTTNNILPEMAEALQKFNETFPEADLAGINKLLETTTESLIKNLYTPLTLTNLLISVKGTFKRQNPNICIMKTFYLPTPIYYVNDKPHIGHAYTTILADVLTRFYRNAGQDVFFLTGLDEHGQKVQQAAEKRGVDPQKHCNEMAPRFLELWENLHIKNDDFIRTTEKRPVDVVQHILQKVYDKGDIYEDEYEGLYSVSEERFITEKEAESGEFRDIKELKEKKIFFLRCLIISSL
ncbi:MAG: hypothetical protein Ct9H300mP29_2670 [Candidatus Neomarinimicrobiota bacterium]|nr:MAG: hypothetical protein Ct9H300mP29_2670 [Candidatus Neomarinimicrobiota bacterium]